MLAQECSSATRRCSKCGEVKPISGFHRRVDRRPGRRPGFQSVCKPCSLSAAHAWNREHREKRNAAKRAREKRQRLAAATTKASGAHLDVMRRALAEHPPELVTETESLAYFRGFIAGAKRSGEEGLRFERLKDLCHRIAAEGKYVKHYEERLSAAYEALLSFIRKRRSFADVEQERKIAARAIRFGIIDWLRLEEGTRNRTGMVRRTGVMLSDVEIADMKADALHPAVNDGTPAEIESIIEMSPRLSERERRVLRALALGKNLREVGEELGLTESRACQIVKEIREGHPELERMLAG